MIGAVVGSFIATVAVRFPASALSGRSRCDHCGRTIPAGDLVPLWSYVRRRGRAACCGSRIDWMHPTAEILGAGIGAISVSLGVPAGIAAALFGLVLLALALIDLRHFRLPDLLVAVLAVAGIAALWIHPLPAAGDRLIGAVAGFVSLEAVRLLYRATRGREGLGAGDPKLFGAIGAWTGWQLLPMILLSAAVLGLLAALLLRLAGRDIGAATRMPFGTLLAAAAWPAWVTMVAIQPI